MFFSDGTVTDISIEKHHVDILINRSDIYDSGSIVTFELSNHAEELDDLSLGEMVTVHHWIDSRKGKAVDARSVEPIEPNTDGSIEPADISLSGERRLTIIAAGRAGWRYRTRTQVEKPGPA